jgi:hypothetical protein
MLDCVDDPDSHVLFNNFSTNFDISVHLQHLGYLARGTRNKIELYWRLLSQASKRFAMEEQVAFDNQYDHNGEVLFI